MSFSVCRMEKNACEKMYPKCGPEFALVPGQERSILDYIFIAQANGGWNPYNCLVVSRCYLFMSFQDFCYCGTFYVDENIPATVRQIFTYLWRSSYICHAFIFVAEENYWYRGTYGIWRSLRGLLRSGGRWKQTSKNEQAKGKRSKLPVTAIPALFKLKYGHTHMSNKQPIYVLRLPAPPQLILTTFTVMCDQALCNQMM